jgi:predicted tellurium resistance membrane protein TerC
VVIGLLISIPIVVLGSKLVLRLVEKWPVIIHIGAAVLAFTAAQMIIHEKLLAHLFEGGEIINNIARGSTYVLAIAGVLGAGWWATRQQVQNDSETQST